MRTERVRGDRDKIGRHKEHSSDVKKGKIAESIWRERISGKLTKVNIH